MPRAVTCSLTTKAITIGDGSTPLSATSPRSRQTGNPHNPVSTFPGEGQSLFRNLKHGFGLKDAWQQSRQALMRWVTVLAVGYAIPQMLAFTDPARLAGLAQPAPWRAPGTRTAGLIQAGIARILRKVGRSAFIAAIWEKIDVAASSTD